MNIEKVLSEVEAFLEIEQLNRNISTKLINNQTSNPLNQWKHDLDAGEIALIDEIIKEYEEEYRYICSFMC